MYTSLESFKSWAGFDEDADDGLLEAMIASATAIIENKTQRKFEVAEETDQVFTRNHRFPNRFDGNYLYFYEELADEASAITDSPTVHYIPQNGPPYYGMILEEGSWAYPEVTVTGYWGHSKTPPPDIEYACLRLSKWLYDGRDTNAGNSAIISPEGLVMIPEGIPEDIMTILRPYIKVGLA